MKINCVRDRNEKFSLETISNTATRKRPAEAPAVLVLLWFWVKTCNEQPVIRPYLESSVQISSVQFTGKKNLAIADEICIYNFECD